MTKIFLKTLSSFYYERMIVSAPSDLTEMVNMGMRLKEGVREGRLTREEGSSAKRYAAFGNKKDGEAHVVTSHIVARYSLPLDLLTKSKVNHTKSSCHRTSIYPKEWLESEQKPKSFIKSKTSKNV